MRISMIAAMAQQRVIGLNNQMPWHLPADLQHFKKVTLGKPVVMGRKTFESIGRPLPGRRNIVISRQSPPADSPVEWVSSIEQALALLAEQPEVMIIGGAEIYRQCLPLAQRLYLTEIALETAGDAFFPDYQAECNWQEIAREEHPQSAENPLGYRFITLERQ
jgi:dihydrofolate reductase